MEPLAEQQTAVRALGLNLLALVALLVLASKSGELGFLTADVSTPDAHVWVLTPYVAPSDELVIDVGATGSMRTGFNEIVVNGAGIHKSFEGPGPTWGMEVAGKREDIANAEKIVAVRIPKDARAGTTIALDIAARVAEAKPTGEGFDNVETARHLVLQVDVRSRAAALGLRFASFVGAISWILFWSVLVSRSYHGGASRVPRWAVSSALRAVRNRFAIFSVFLIAVYAVASVVGFVHPLRAAIGFTGDTATAGLVALALIIPVWLGKKLAGPAPIEPLLGKIEPLGDSEKSIAYRESASSSSSIHAQRGLDQLVTLMGTRAAMTPRGMIVTVGGSLYRAPRTAVELLFETDTLELGKIALCFNDSELLLRVAIALLPVLGPFALELRRGTETYRYVIDRATNARSVVEKFRQAQWDQIELEQARGELLALLEARANSRGAPWK